ncbi:4-hydroxy-3-methylbut-2-enyl diphosphate reductase [hydrothermal vent metagenome]|uniref:4-hydroxy-3-methylbut-2-enyl diphosphate reductase n=1 Tax=hydrothermal vent metagenome TaxID=652676 RepID=A0A3B0UYB1_9ZZZZ
MKITLANPRGFCAGVDRAIEIVNRAIELFGAPIYVKHEVVHNRFVVNNLKAKGAIFVEELEEIPDNNIVIFSAHGVSQLVRRTAAQRNLKVFDATCPLVTKVHMEVMHYCKNNYNLILIGHQGHPEVEGTIGQWDYTKGTGAVHIVESVADIKNLKLDVGHKLAYVTQTTLSLDDTADIIAELKLSFPQIQGPKHDDICYATQNRQLAVKNLAHNCDLMLVVGSVNSSNSNRLHELAERQGIKAYLIDDAGCIKLDWLHNIHSIGVTAGASAPEKLVQDVIDFLAENTQNISINELHGEPENMVFALPKELRP